MLNVSCLTFVSLLYVLTFTANIGCLLYTCTMYFVFTLVLFSSLVCLFVLHVHVTLAQDFFFKLCSLCSNHSLLSGNRLKIYENPMYLVYGDSNPVHNLVTRQNGKASFTACLNSLTIEDYTWKNSIFYIFYR